MLKAARLGLPAVLFFFCPVPNAQATMNKCTDGRQITYTTEPCEKTGLTSAGPIKNAVTVMPFVPKTPKNTSEKPGKNGDAGGDNPQKTAPARDDSGADVSRDLTIKPVSPLATKMLNW